MAAVQKNAATAVLAAVGRYTLVALLLAVVVASLLWTAFGPQGAWTLAWIALQPKGVGDG